MNAIVLLSQYGLSSIRGTIARMSNSVEVFIKRTDGSWRQMRKDGRIRLIKEPIFNSSDIVIRWGNSIPLSGKFVAYNEPKAVSLASNKGEFRRIMMENEIPIPTPYQKDSTRWPMVVRPLHHHAGKNFHVAKNNSEVETLGRKYKGDMYISEVYPKQREVRVHCCSGKVLLIKEKPAPDDKSIIAWNFAINEEAWSTIDRQDYDPNICRLALDAMKAIGLDIGAVDIMFDPSDKSYAPYVVCEINTAPSLTEYLEQKYAMYFDCVFNNRSGKLEPWDYTKFKEGKSFSWKNEQLGASRSN